jgi:LysE type translocator
MNRSLFITYMLTLTVLMLTPGPDMLFCLASGLKGGPRSGLLAATGAATGEVVHISTAAVGLAAIFRAAPLLFDTCGFLAPPTCCGSASAHSTTVTRPWAKGTRPARAPTAPTWRGLLTNLLKSKGGAVHHRPAATVHRSTGRQPRLSVSCLERMLCCA